MSIIPEQKNVLTENPPADPVVHEAAPRTGRRARQPLSIFGRITFWTSIVRVLGGVGALVPFMILGGLPLDILMITVSSLIIVVLMFTRFRWAPLVSIPLAALVLYLTFSEPFALFDLANPYGPNGGFGLFIAGVVAFALSLLALGGSIGATLENYRLVPRSRWLPAAFASLIVGLIIGATFIGFISPPPATATATTNGVPTIHMGAGGFDHPSITLSKGSKLLLVDDSAVVHVIFNGSWQNNTPRVTQEPGAPVVNGLTLSSNSVTIGPFNQAGTYHLLCTVHRGMNLTIIVH
ncbi:MAG: hypothetical protein M3Y81_03765 [Chloroflexota bacterium]|nr:hypothetical protein [Chloroflexota bacterium]